MCQVIEHIRCVGARSRGGVQRGTKHCGMAAGTTEKVCVCGCGCVWVFGCVGVDRGIVICDLCPWFV